MDALWGIDLRALALFRIGLALVYLCDLGVRAQDLRAFYTDYGILPRIAHLQTYQDPWFLSVNMISGSTLIQIILFVIAGLAGIALLAGYRSKPAAVLSWFMILSLDARNPLILGEGVFIRIFLFWGMFLPLGARYSIDRVLNNSSKEIPSRILSMGTVAILLQISLIYFCAGLHKIHNQDWLNGTALFSSLNYDPLTKPLGYSLLQFPGLTKALTYAVMGFEIIGPLLLLCPVLTIPLRIMMFFVFICLQLGFFLFLELGPLVWTMIVGIIPFLPSCFWDFIHQKLSTTQPHLKTLKIALKECLSKRLSFRPVSISASRLSAGLVTLCFLYVATSNWTSFSNYQIPYSLRRFGGSLLWMDQYWNMFSPPPRTGGWNVIEGKQINGTSVDLLNKGNPLSWEKPALISATFKSQLWRKFWQRILNTGYEIPRTYYAQYLCREWNKHHQEADQIVELEIFQMQTIIAPQHEQVTEPQKISYGKYTC